MGSRNETTSRLLPKTAQPDQEREGWALPAFSGKPACCFIAVPVHGASFGFVLLPRVPHLKTGDIRAQEHHARRPCTLSMRADQTLLFARVKRGEVIAEAGKRITDRSAAIIARMGRREGIGKPFVRIRRPDAPYPSRIYLFLPRRSNRYRARPHCRPEEIISWHFLLILTIVISQFSRTIMLLIADAFALDRRYRRLRLPVASGAMLVSLPWIFHLALVRFPSS